VEKQMRYLFIALLFVTVTASAQLTLSEKNALSENAVFRGRVYQGLVSKANYFVTLGTASNLMQQKQLAYAKHFVQGKASIELYIVTRYWLANYNSAPILDNNSQPVDNEILNTAALDTVFNTLAGVNAGDELLPVQ
jgi:hypothetical protein